MIGRSLNFLILEDNEDDAILLVRELRRGGLQLHFARAETAEEMEAQLNNPWDVIISDYSMPRLTVDEALMLLEKRDLDIPFIVVSGAIGEQTAVSAMKSGAHDYLMKDNLARLVPAIERELREARQRRARRQAEDDHLRSQHMVAQIAATVPNVIYLYQLRPLKMLFVNDSVKHMLGYSRAEVMSETFMTGAMAWLHPDELAFFAVWSKDLMQARDGQIIQGEFRVRNAGGQWNWLQRSETVFARFDDGAPSHVLGTALDITERKTTEEALRRSEAKTRALLAALPDTIFQMHRDGTLAMTANASPPEVPESAHSHGHTSTVHDAAEGRALPAGPGTNIRTRLPPEVAEQFLVHAEQALSTGRMQSFEYRDKLDSNPVDYEVRIVVSGEDEVLAIVRDITTRKHMQAQLLSVDRMVSVGTLAAGIAHEINNPLAYVMANLDLISRALSTFDPAQPAGSLAELEEMVSDARDGAERVRRIVRDVKTFSRVDEERRVPVDVARLLDSTVGMAWNEIRHRARLIKDYGRVPPVLANEARLGQVFLNLLINAAQAIPEGAAERNVIRIVTRVSNTNEVVIEVRDSGAGIPPEVISRIFDPFFTTKPIGVGTGLGLSICQNFVTAMDGTITVESTVGQGTLFSVSLPADTSLVPVERPPPPEAAQVGAPRARVLVVDDEVALARAIQRMLASEHDVSTVSNGREALELLVRDSQFDVIFCDLLMPEVTGMELYDALREKRPGLEQRMIFMTGGAFTPRAREFLDTIPNHRIEKPLDPQNVRALVRDRVSGARSHGLEPVR